MNTEDAAYFAGFFDGEGSVGIYYYGDQPQFRVSLCNNIIEPLLRAVQLFGGKIRPRLRNYQGEIRNNHEWYIHGRNAENFLRIIRPYLLVKSDQVDVFLAARAAMPGAGGRRENGEPGSAYRTSDYLQQLEQAVTMLKDMKRRS